MFCSSCRAPNDETSDVCSACGQALTPIPRGTKLGRYEILSVLGRGGMGVVYRARDVVLDEPVALKAMRAELVATPALEQRFRSEIKLARRVSHPNVCRIHHYDEEGSVRYIAMELVEGTDLKQRLKRKGPPPAEEAFEIAIQAAEGLEAVHRVGIVHRDLKPSNIMVDTQGVVRLMDFGIAKHVAARADEDSTGSGYIVGTPEYMSPEQARGRALDARSDIYSLGVVVFELFAGHVPFADDTPVATILRLIEDAAPLEDALASSLPPALLPVLRRALAKRPDERFASARALADALRLARDEHRRRDDAGPLAIAPTLRRPRPHARGGRWWSIVAAAVVALAAVLFFAIPRTPRAALSSSSATPVPVASLAPSPTPEPIRTLPALAAPTDVPPTRTAAPATKTDPPSPSPAPAVTEAPTALPTPVPLPTATREPPRPTPMPVPTTGFLQLSIRPWAYVSVDGVDQGQTPRSRLELDAGSHDVVLTHPEYQPHPRKITIRPGETYLLQIDLRQLGVRKKSK